MMKKILALILGAAFLLSLCACGDEGSSQASAQSSESVQTETNTIGTKQGTTSAASASDNTAAGSDPAQPTIESTLDNQKQDQLVQIMNNYGFSGVVSVTKNGKTVCRNARGVAHPSTGEAISADSLFCIGSVSKQFAAASIMLLQEDGKLSVDDNIGKYYPSCVFGNEVTLKNMLSMRSGIAEFYDSYVDGGNLHELPYGELSGVLTNGNTAEQNRDTLEQWLIQQPLTFAPGSMNAYCNSNFFLLARIVEKVSGVPYEQFVKERIFKPLGMKNSGFIDELLGDGRLAENPNPNPQTVYVGITMGLGDMITNAADIDLWLASFSGNKLLSQESIAAMTTNYSAADESPYGFGVQPAGSGFYHWGYFTSYCAYVYTDPAAGYTMFAVSNDCFNMAGDMSEMCQVIASATYE